MADGNVMTAMHNGVREERRGAAMVLTLDRGGALNALTPAMIAALDQGYRRAARDPGVYVAILKSADPKAFSAGGDVRALSATARTDFGLALRHMRDEYAFNWLHECFSKPTVALINGIVMGSGVGVSAYATHRVAGPNYRFAMPETAIGFFPDIGAAHVFARMPACIGRYLGLTGHAIGRADAFALELITHTLEEPQFAAIEAGLADAEPVDPLLDDRHRDPGASPLMAHRDMIERCFGTRSIEETMARLAEVRGPSQAFAGRALADLQKRAPLALKVTLRHIQEAAGLDLRQTLEADFRLANRFLASTDFHEGVRAALIDKDQAPRWQPAALADVTPHRLDDMFAPLPSAELNLPLRQEMQALRV